jgi:predicted nuclease of predicted toxin-antitoxin system
MRFLLDESCDFAVARVLRMAGHDVMVVAESAQGAEDEEVIALAVREGRILLTEDKDFGWLVYAHLQEAGGVIFIRFPANVRAMLPKAILDLVDEMGERLTGCFVVVQPGRIRIGRRPHG